MKSLKLTLFSAFFCLASSLVVAAEEEGFTCLFDGKTLTGWNHTGKNGTETAHITGYVVENGVLRCTPEGKFLHTPKKYKNFVVRLEYKLPAGGNNGIGIRTPMPGNPAFDGMEIQLLDDTAEKYKTLADYQYNGSVYGIIPCKRGHLKPLGEWNEIEVTAVGSKIRVVLNGATIVDGDIVEATKNGPLDHRKHPGLHNEAGYLVLCGHGDPVEFRNIRIKEIK